jgi:hypothetical protein
MDILNLDKPLRTSEAMVQVQPDLKAGVYVVDLVLLDEAGEQSSAQISFEIQGRVVRPGPVIPPVIPPVVVTPVNPSIFTEVVTPVVRPVATPAATPVAPPVTPAPSTPIRRGTTVTPTTPIKPKKPTDPTQ